MSMNGIDFNKQLSKEREYFTDTNRKVKESTRKEVEDTNNRAELVMDKQRQGFIEDKAELESSYQKNLDHLKKKTSDSLSSNSAEYNKALEQERKSFTDESLRKRNEFNDRLNGIKSSYQKSMRGETDRNEMVETSLKTKFKDNLGDITKDTEEKVTKFSNRMSDETLNLKGKYADEQREMGRKHDDKLSDVIREGAHQRAEEKYVADSYNKKIKKNATKELAFQKEYNQDSLKSINKKYEDRFQGMTKDYNQRNEVLVKQQREEALKTNRSNQANVEEIKAKFGQQLNDSVLAKRRADNGSADFDNFQKDHMGNRKDSNLERKIKNLKDDVLDTQRTYTAKAMQDQKGHNNTLKEQETEAMARQDKKLFEANRDKMSTVAYEIDKADNAIMNREHQNRIEKSTYESQIMHERKGANERLTALKENFNRSMKQIDDQHQASIEDVKTVSTKDKNDFLKKVQEGRSKEVFEMKRAFGKMMDSTVQDYEHRLAMMQRDNENLKLTMDQKIQNLTDQTQKQLESQRTLFEDRRTADLQGQQLVMDQRENNLKKNFSDMNLGYQRKIDKLQSHSDTKLKLITNDYETKLKELRATTAKELGMKDATHMDELDKLRRAYDEERQRVVNTYENQIAAMKESHKDSMDSMKNFKRLS